MSGDSGVVEHLILRSSDLSGDKVSNVLVTKYDSHNKNVS